MPVLRVLLGILALSLLQGADLDDQIASAIAKSDLKKPRLGLLVYSTKTNGEACGRDSKKIFYLASNTKLLTTSCALSMLGPDYRFRTTLAWNEGGGDLHVFGAGDTLISGRLHNDDPTALFRDAAAQLRKNGCTRFPGDLVVHAGMFDKVARPAGWAKQNAEAWYAAPVGALVLNDSCIDVVYEAGATGGPAKVSLRPDTKYLTLVNRATTVKSPTRDFIVDRKGNEIVVSGEVASGTARHTAFVAIEDPAKFFGTVLKETLEHEGISIEGKVVESDALKLDGKTCEFILAEHSLGDAVKWCNTVSQNLHAEMILKLLGFRFRGAGTTEAGVEVVKEFLKTEIGATDTTQVDGSGLSRDNRSSPGTIVGVLNYMKNHRHGKAFVESLAVAGQEPGTLRNRLKSVAGKVRGKTGTLDGVSSLSGYAESAGGDTFVFSILMNGWEGGSPHNLQDKIVELLVKNK